MSRYLLLVLFFLGLLFPAYTVEAASGTVIPDWKITADVKIKMLSDPLLKNFDIGVETNQMTVTLTGTVNDKDTRDHAGKVARTVNGVKRVHNLIRFSTQ
jgi:hyperosmotically inducible protein